MESSTTSILSAIKGEKLKDPHQWRMWFARVKLYAKQRKFWQLPGDRYGQEVLHNPRSD
jgi:hypothetical protein